MMNDQNGFTPETVARLVRWVLIIFFVYVFVTNLPNMISSTKTKAQLPASIQAVLPAAQEKPESKDCAGSVFNNYSLFAVPLFPVTSDTVAVSDIKTGTGSPASCGQKASFRYSFARRGGDIIYSNMESGEETKDVLIGSKEIIPGMSRGIIGMKTGGERDVTIPPSLGFAEVEHMENLRDHNEFKFGGITGFLSARVKLLSLAPALPESPLKLRLLDQTMGTGTTVECGDEVSLKLTLWKLDGTSLYSNDTGEPLHFTVGSSQLPYGIEEGVIGMQPDGKRTLIIPPAYTKPLLDNEDNRLLKDVTIPENEILLAVVQVMQPAKTAPAKAVSSPDAKPADATKK